MVKNPKIDNDEINLTELMLTVWEGKWKIAAAVVISFIAVISYQSTQTKNFTAITELKPVNSLSLNKYVLLNNTIKLTDIDSKFNFQEITKSNLLNLYIDILNDKSIFEDAMHKLNFLDASQYSDEQEYNEAIIKLASSVKILSPKIDKKKNNFKNIISKIENLLKKSKKCSNIREHKIIIKAY